MQNETPKIIGRRPVYPARRPVAAGIPSSSPDNRGLFGEKTLQSPGCQTRHTITVLGRLSSCLSDK